MGKKAQLPYICVHNEGLKELKILLPHLLTTLWITHQINTKGTAGQKAHRLLHYLPGAPWLIQGF